MLLSKREPDCFDKHGSVDQVVLCASGWLAPIAIETIMRSVNRFHSVFARVQGALTEVMAALAQYGDMRTLNANDKPLFVAAAKLAVKVCLVNHMALGWAEMGSVVSLLQTHHLEHSSILL